MALRFLSPLVSAGTKASTYRKELLPLFHDEYQPQGFTINEVAVKCGVKPVTVRAWICRKEMRAMKVGYRRYVTPQQLREFQEFRSSGEYVDMTYAYGPVKR